MGTCSVCENLSCTCWRQTWPTYWVRGVQARQFYKCPRFFVHFASRRCLSRNRLSCRCVCCGNCSGGRSVPAHSRAGTVHPCLMCLQTRLTPVMLGCVFKLAQGLKLVADMTGSHGTSVAKQGGTISGADAFKLYSSAFT